MKTKIEVMSFDGVRRMVEVGLGVAILPFGALEDSNLAMVPINEPWALRDLVVVTKPGVELGEQHRQCSTVCLEETTLYRKTPDSQSRFQAYCVGYFYQFILLNLDGLCCK